MALSDPYAYPSEYRARISPNKDDSQDDAILEDLIAVSRYLEGKADRCFNRDDGPVTRDIVIPHTGHDYDYRHYVEHIRLEDFAEQPSEVLLDLDMSNKFLTVLDPVDYECLPREAPLRPDPHPFTSIHLMPLSRMYFLPGTRMRVTVTWGWPAVPLGVKIKTIHLTALLRLESDRATRRIPTDIDTVIETSIDAMRIVRELIDDYRETWFLM